MLERTAQTRPTRFFYDFPVAEGKQEGPIFSQTPCYQCTAPGFTCTLAHGHPIKPDRFIDEQFFMTAWEEYHPSSPHTSTLDFLVVSRLPNQITKHTLKHEIEEYKSMCLLHGEYNPYMQL